MQITIHTLNIHLTPAEPTLGAALVKAALAAQHEEAAQRSHITSMDVLMASPSAPIPKHIRDGSLIQVLAAQQCILRGQAITHQWRAVVDAVNIMETLRRAGHIQDPGGHIYAAVEAILRAIERKKAIERRAKYLREWLMYGMSIAQIQKIECPQFRISIANNPESVDIYEPDLIPAEYMRQPEQNLWMILEAK